MMARLARLPVNRLSLLDHDDFAEIGWRQKKPVKTG
jgi:hypothetical protein